MSSKVTPSNLKASKTNSTKKMTDTVKNGEKVKKEDVADEKSAVDKRIDGLLEQVKVSSGLLKEITRNLRSLRTDCNKDIRAIKREKQKSTKKRGNPHTGFAQKNPISKELCDFFELSQNTWLARTEAVQMMSEYIKKNKLEDPNNKTIIIPDAKLEALVGKPAERLMRMQEHKLKLETEAKRRPHIEKLQKKAQNCEVTDKLGYFNINIHLTPHFPKPATNDKVKTEISEEIPTAALVSA